MCRGQLLESTQLIRPLLIACPPLHPTLFTEWAPGSHGEGDTAECTSGGHNDRTKARGEEDLASHPSHFQPIPLPATLLWLRPL